jgi:membrane protein implicated in regulation of membrane protease activity
MNNWVNWMLVIVGVVCIIVELLMGAITGFDLALLGVALSAGGAVGLFFSSAKIGLFSAGALAFVYMAFIRRWVRAKLSVKNQPSNVDALIGRTGIVTSRIAAHEPGRVKIGEEVWRAELARQDGAARDAGAEITVESVEGVTLRVR